MDVVKLWKSYYYQNCLIVIVIHYNYTIKFCTTVIFPKLKIKKCIGLRTAIMSAVNLVKNWRTSQDLLIIVANALKVIGAICFLEIFCLNHFHVLLFITIKMRTSKLLNYHFVLIINTEYFTKQYPTCISTYTV